MQRAHVTTFTSSDRLSCYVTVPKPGDFHLFCARCQSSFTIFLSSRLASVSLSCCASSHLKSHVCTTWLAGCLDVFDLVVLLAGVPARGLYFSAHLRLATTSCGAPNLLISPTEVFVA